MTDDRNPDGTFKSIEEKGESDAGGGGEDTATERTIEDRPIHGDADDQDQFLESFDKPGLGAEEAGSRIEEMIRAAQDSEGEAPEGADPDALETARRALDEEGSLEAAQQTLEENLKAEEAEQAEAEASEGPQPVPFEHLAQDLGFDDPQQAAEAVRVRAKIDGEETDLTLSEALEGYQRQADYTRKTQELSEERQEVQQAKEHYAQQLEMIGVTLGDQLNQKQQQALVQEYNRVVSQVSEAATPDPESIQEEQEQLRETFEWESDNEWESARSNIRDYAHDLGFSDQDLASVTDHRLLAVVEKARRYDELEETIGRDPTKDAERPSKTLKPGVNKRTAESVEQTRQRSREEGRTGTSKPALKAGSSDSVEDAAGKIEHLLDSGGA